MLRELGARSPDFFSANSAEDLPLRGPPSPSVGRSWRAPLRLPRVEWGRGSEHSVACPLPCPVRVSGAIFGETELAQQEKPTMNQQEQGPQPPVPREGCPQLHGGSSALPGWSAPGLSRPRPHREAGPHRGERQTLASSAQGCSLSPQPVPGGGGRRGLDVDPFARLRGCLPS